MCSQQGSLLFVCRQVEVDGYVKCTETRWTRLYFVVFNIMTAMIMINILTGVLLDLYTLHAENTKVQAAQSNHF